MARLDPHSHADSSQPQTRSLSLRVRPDFASHLLHATATLQLDGEGLLDLDTRDLTIHSVRSLEGRRLDFELSGPDPILGSRLRIASVSRGVVIESTTSPQASAMQWLVSSGKPFLFTQCQPIHARSLFPLQDTPRTRVTVERASFETPPGLRALMAGKPLAQNEFSMPQPIPPYLLAFAIGDLVERKISDRCSVWAEPFLADAAAWEFAALEETLAAAERLFGPYDWERADLLVMPPSFPYGGMENPRLTFLTPSVIAGDRSLVSVVAHELAHAWTGNLVTNANANHFWLNEGFTVYAERRILEALYGRERSELGAAIGAHDLANALKRFADRPELTRLRTNLEGIHPDEAYSQVPYEKGYFFLRALEEAAGRERFDSFLREYLRRFRFQSIETDDFLGVLRERLPEQFAISAKWIDQPGLPDDAPRPFSPRLEGLRKGTIEPADPTELLIYLQNASPDRADEIDARYGVSKRRSLELRTQLALLQLRGSGATDLAAQVVSETGRMKFLKPIYTELARRSRADAQRIWAANVDRYHPIAREVIEPLLA
jgi:leukotriene-A4 hydrolase